MDILEIIIDQDSTNKELNDLIQIVGNYNSALIHYKAGEYEASEIEFEG